MNFYYIIYLLQYLLIFIILYYLENIKKKTNENITNILPFHLAQTSIRFNSSNVNNVALSFV